MPPSTLVNSGTLKINHKASKSQKVAGDREIPTRESKQSENFQHEILSKEEEIKCWLREVLSTNSDFALPAEIMTTRNNTHLGNKKRVAVKRSSPADLKPRKTKRVRLGLGHKSNNQVKPNSRNQISPPRHASPLKTKRIQRDTLVKHRRLNIAIRCK